MTIRGTQPRSGGPAIGLGVVGIAALLVLIIAIFVSFTQVGVGEVGRLARRQDPWHSVLVSPHSLTSDSSQGENPLQPSQGAPL